MRSKRGGSLRFWPPLLRREEKGDWWPGTLGLQELEEADRRPEWEPEDHWHGIALAGSEDVCTMPRVAETTPAGGVDQFAVDFTHVKCTQVR